MRERPILIAYRRFEQLQELLFARGYLVDPGSRDPNEWRDDPPLGLVRLKGVALRGEGDDAEPDPRITFSIVELWSTDRVEDAHEEQGYWGRDVSPTWPESIRKPPRTSGGGGRCALLRPQSAK